MPSLTTPASSPFPSSARTGGDVPLDVPLDVRFGERVRGVIERLYLVVISVAALFVAYLGFLAPARMRRSFTWVDLPPLHARFVASLYLFGAVYIGLCALSRRRDVREPAVGGTVIFTGVLISVTLMNPKAFDYDLAPVWVWTVSYVVYPLLGLALLAGRRAGGSTRPDDTGDEMPRVLTIALRVVAALSGLVGVLLFLDRELMVRAWPWKVSNGLAQTYAAPMLAIAYCATRSSLASRRQSLRAFGPALLVLGVATLASTLRHRAVLGATDASVVVWFVASAAVGVTGLVMSFVAWRRVGTLIA